MSSKSRPLIVLVANNPYGHHLLTSQLLDTYGALNLDGAEIVLLCNGRMPSADPPSIRVVSFASRFGGMASSLNLILKLVHLRFTQPNAVYHLRGFVTGFLFCISRLCMLGGARFIYDPRGAFFLEWREAGRSRILSRLFGCVEARLIRHSVATIVTSDRFARLYRRLFGDAADFVTIYNATSFAYHDAARPLPKTGPLRLVYLGTFNHWHDMGEVARVMDSAARQIGRDRTELFIFCPDRFHTAVRQTFGTIGYAALTVDYVRYHDIPARLAKMHIGVSVVRPTLSTRIASPIKVADYVALGLVPLLNRGIGDFDAYFTAEGSAILYDFGSEVDVLGLADIRAAPNRRIYDAVSRGEARDRLSPVVERLCDDRIR